MTEQAQPSGPEYEFTNDWFNQTASLPVWRQIISNNKPTKILEIGSFEGRSTCWLIETCTTSIQSDIQICCVDSWEGGIEHKEGAGKSSEMSDVEERFDRNISIAKSRVKFNSHIRKIKKYSHQALPMLMSEGNYEFFDLIYIDGSHQAPDVLTDAIMSFQLLRVGGVMIFDDYLWSMDKPGNQDVLKMPKLAIDAFLNIFQRKMSIYIGPPISQIYARKISN
ncbi:MAG: class I SAM-dependent methyltransferase [Phenylobacterium sp.]